MARQEVIFEEAQVKDAKVFLDFMRTVSLETDFVVSDESLLEARLEEVEATLGRIFESERDLCLVAKVADNIIGLISINGQDTQAFSHIGDLFIAVLKDYWGCGIGRILVEEALHWVREMSILKRIELTVQCRNEAAIHLYQTCGFEVEGTKKRGTKSREGKWLDLYYMAKLID